MFMTSVLTLEMSELHCLIMEWLAYLVYRMILSTAPSPTTSQRNLAWNFIIKPLILEISSIEAYLLYCIVLPYVDLNTKSFKSTKKAL
jgi:hypothetical protein